MFEKRTPPAPVVEQAETIADLRAKLDRPAGGIVFTTIQKFARFQSGAGGGMFMMQGDNIFVFAWDTENGAEATIGLGLMALLIAASPSDTLESLLARGPLVSVETGAGGKFDAAVGFAELHRFLVK